MTNYEYICKMGAEKAAVQFGLYAATMATLGLAKLDNIDKAVEITEAWLNSGYAGKVEDNDEHN